MILGLDVDEQAQKFIFQEVQSYLNYLNITTESIQKLESITYTKPNR